MNFRIFVWIFLAGLLTDVAKGQSISSPYSNNGLGEIAFQGLVNNYGMGEVGIGSPTIWHINIQNPSFLVFNSFSTFQVGIDGDIRRYATSGDTHAERTASLRFLAMSFPVVRARWTSSFALVPLSSVNFNTFSRDSIGSALRVNQYQGEGGLSQLIWGNGFRIYKGLSAGLSASYTFGNITKESRDQIFSEDIVTSYAISYVENTTYSDFNFATSLGYRWNIKENYYMNFGAVYEISQKLKGNSDAYFERKLLNGTTVQSNTVAEDEPTSFHLPVSYGFGVSLEKINNLKLGADLKAKNWENGNSETSSATLRNTFDVAVGGEWTPDYQSVNSYMQRVSYRFGFNVKQLPYLVNNTEINDFGINFGASFPVSGYSSLDAAFKFGLRGTTENNLVRENYFRIVIGATINDNQWFIKRRYD